MLLIDPLVVNASDLDLEAGTLDGGLLQSLKDFDFLGDQRRL
jgi:hypothetical protein